VRLASLRPPRLRTLDEEERAATWLELFYDLVFVAAVAVLGGRILDDPSWTGVLTYSAYFGLLWWLWSSHTFYADRFDTDDLAYRLLATAQIIAIVVLAASLTADSASTLAFAIGYATARLILLGLYARAYIHVEVAQNLIAGYLKGFGIAAILWVTAIFVPEPWRFWVWGLALAVDLRTVHDPRSGRVDRCRHRGPRPCPLGCSCNDHSDPRCPYRYQPVVGLLRQP
jgi:low temperature requirement protein LtrA